MPVSFVSKPSTPGTSFNSTRECLSTMFNLLKCVSCSEVPRDDIWTPGDCNHKYCKSCIKKLDTNKCTICEVKSLQKDRALDVFSTNLLEELRTFVAQVREEYELSESDVGLEFTLNSVVPTTAERADSEDKESVISSLRCNSDGDDDQPPTHGAKNTKEINSAPKICKKSSSSSTPKSTTKSTPVKNGAKPKLNVSSTPDILAKLFDNGHESDEHSYKDVAVDNEDVNNIIEDGDEDFNNKIEDDDENVNNKIENDDEDGDSDIEIDKDLPVLTPVPLSQTRAMSRRGTVESLSSVQAQSPFKSPQPKQNKRTPMRKDIPVLTPHTTSATLKDASRDSCNNSDGEEPLNSVTTRRTKKKNSLQPEIWLERVDDDNSTHRGSKKPKNLLKSESRINATKNKGKKIQREPVEIGLDDDAVDPKLSDDELSHTSSNVDSNSDSEFKTSKSKRKTPLGKKPKALSTSATGRSHLKSESFSPFGIKPVDSAESEENKRFFKRGLLSSKANRSTLTSNSRSGAKPGVTKPNPFVTPPTSHRRSSTGSSSAFTAVKSKKLGTKETAKMGDKNVQSCTTTPIAKSVFDFHGTQSQVISPLKKLSGVITHENDKGSAIKRRRTPSLSSLGSSVASSEDVESTPKNSKTTTANESKRAKGLAANIKRDRPPSIASSNSTTASIKNSPSGVVGRRNRKGETPLHLAARDGQLEKVKQFIEDGGDIDAKDYAGWTPLHEAINGKVLNFEVVKLLCSSGCDVNALGMYDETPLHEACRLGLTNVVSYLLSQSASPAIRNSAGKLPRDVTSSDAVIKIMSDYEKQNTGQSQVNNDVSVELKISLQKAVFYFNYKPSKDVLKSCKSVLDMNIVTELTSKVTHLILDIKPKSKTQLSREYLLSILNGCWMLSSKWLEDSISVKRFLDPRKYEVGGCHYKNIPSPTCDSAIERARVNREHGNPGLFDGMHFYLYKSTSWPSKIPDQDQVVPSSCVLSKKDIAKLITFGSGKVINREPDPEAVDPLETPLRFHASAENANTSNHKLVLTSHVILYDDKNVPPKKYDMEHVKTLRIDWLIHSAVNFQLLHPDSYLE